MQIEACVREGRWLNPAPFEIRDYLPAMASNRAMRRSACGARNGPLKDVAVFISRARSLKPSIDALQRMVLQAGGKVQRVSLIYYIFYTYYIKMYVPSVSCVCVFVYICMYALLNH